MLVIDANVVVDLCVSKAGFDALADHELVAPPLLRAEALSVLHVMHWRRVVSPHVIDTALERLGSAPIRFADPRGLAHEVLANRRGVRLEEDLRRRVRRTRPATRLRSAFPCPP